jgi:hypothetical protein
MVVGAAFLGEVFCNVLLLVFGIFHADNELIVGVEVGRDLFGNSRLAAIELPLLVCGARKWFGRASFGAWFWRLERSSISLEGDEEEYTISRAG